MKPLTSLLEKGKEFKWDEACQKCFEELKKRLTTAPILVMPDIHKGFDVYCDASHLVLGCVLMQEGKVGVVVASVLQAIQNGRHIGNVVAVRALFNEAAD